MLKIFTNYLQKIKSNPFILQSLNTLILRVLGVLILFGFTLFLTNNFSPKIVGQYDFVRSFLLVIGSICLLGCDQSILYFRGRLKDANALYALKEIYIKMVGILFSMSIILFLIVLCTNKELINTFFSDQGVHLILLKSSGILFFSALTTLNTEVFRALDRLYVAELFRNTIKYIPLILGAILLFYVKKEIYLVDVFLIGFVILAVITSVLVFNYFSKAKTNTINEPVTYKEIVVKSYPIAISGMALFLLMSFDIMFLKKYRDDATVAFYSLAVKLMTILSMVIVTVNITVSTKIAEYFSIKNNAELNKIVKNSSRLIFILTLPATVLIGIFSEYILSFFGKDYVAAKDALLILIVGQGICSAFGSASVYLNMTGRQHVFQVILVAAVLINFVLNRLLIPEYGMTGAAITFVASSFFWNFISTVVIYYKDKVKVYLN
ncbi:oligosaccharide flippase family protein [Flavobacterium gawalongense]|uniref:Oligosaccharide flippase family protein n=1 Tax=Flavobacterium gawalongense TaxID=2594432 RepID=A0A553BWK8_9FLAO|nr:oligosaccharide flippase family protein [Flavobacterium gawalongense]TRX08488.1 oligosaccharide flippase family protein [Flavobacterium gawalongense]TRX09710.1 oligosaccharide flippase family protein [Flavobacterium gawalongense]TRX12599.1 oligosaccharide flippase family protein [Flavobacterium gawalongense]TRX26833.1 oligosaccharide flippase family protein [Flavobacterium gawalongense]